MGSPGGTFGGREIMTRIIRSALVALIALGTFRAQAEPCGSPNAQPAPDCIDCSVAGGCQVYKYGLGDPSNFSFRKSPDTFALTEKDFPKGSYFYIRSDLNSPTVTNCGPERDFQPIQGQVVLREQVSCVPTSEGPTGPGGCPVEIPIDISGVTPPKDKTTWSNGSLSIGTTTILSSSSATLGGTSNPANAQCVASNIRLIPAQGTRYLLPASRGGDGTKTYIHWLDTPGHGLYRHEDDSQFCCISTTGLGCAAAGGFTEYPIILQRNCGIAGRIYQLLDTNDWIFDAGPGTPFITDPEHIVANEIHGVCKNNRFQGCTKPGTNSVCTGPSAPHTCCTGAGTGTCGTECNNLDGDPNTPGLQPDTCDLREPGLRQTRPGNLSSGFPDPTRCSTVLAVLRGTPNQYCTLNNKYDVNGDPGSDCLVWNFGFRPRPDLDCNGVEDTVQNGGTTNDLCPFYNEYDYFKDTDGDCAGNSSRCRGDECECGDQDINGRVNVSDLIAINLAIFDPSQKRSICDANNDLNCNVSDIVAANVEIFSPDTATCRHITSIQCGNNVVDAGEACDDGGRCQGGATPGAVCNAVGGNTCGTGGSCVRLGGDGCNTACRVEPGYTCTGSPSVCTRP
jgi:hypothetical protein